MRTVNRKKLCEYLGGIGDKTLRRWLGDGLDKARLKLGTRARSELYDLDAVDAWLRRDQQPAVDAVEPAKEQKPKKGKRVDLKAMIESLSLSSSV